MLCRYLYTTAGICPLGVAKSNWKDVPFWLNAYFSLPVRASHALQNVEVRPSHLHLCHGFFGAKYSNGEKTCAEWKRDLVHI